MKPTILARAVGVAFTLAAVVCGCGTNETSQSAQVKAVVHGFLSEQVDGKPSEACKFLTRRARVELVTFVARESQGRRPKTCEDALGLAHDRTPNKLLDALRTADITDVHVDGNHATVMVRGGAAFTPQEVSLKRAFGHMGRPWRIDDAPHLGG